MGWSQKYEQGYKAGLLHGAQIAEKLTAHNDCWKKYSWTKHPVLSVHVYKEKLEEAIRKEAEKVK